MQLMRVASSPGVQRDGTNLDGKAYADAQWCRFQRGLPKKMGGYRVTQAYLNAVSRALYAQAKTGLRYVTSGHQFGLDQFTIDNFGTSTGVASPALPGFTANANTSWQFDTQYDNTTNKTLLFAHGAQNLVDPTNAANFPIYYGDVYAPGGAMTALSPGTGNLAVQVSGGMCSLAPYMTIFGNDGYWAWSQSGLPTGFDNVANPALTGATRITGKKILRGIPLRSGGGNSPAGIYWSIDALIRVNFVGGSTTWQFDQLTTQSSVLSAASIIQHDGIYYWAGVDRFLMFNGVMQEIPNSMNLNWFYDGINQVNAGKCFAMKVPRYGEIWWCYPRGTNTECSHAVIYNYREKYWYDTVLPNQGRSSGIHTDNLIGNLMGGTLGQTVTPVVLSSVATSSGGSAVYTGTVTGGDGNAFAGQRFTVTGFATAANNGTFLCTASTATTLTLTTAAALNETHAATATPLSFYNLWEHEQGTDEFNGAAQNSILSSFTTGSISSFDADPPHNEGITVQAFQPDFVQSGDMTVTVLKQNNANEPQYAGTTAIIYANAIAETGNSLDQATNFKDTAKIIQLKFISNVLGGNYQMGRCMMEIDSDGQRET